MSPTIYVKWQAEDGYVGGSRPQETCVEVSDFIGLDRDEAEKLLNEILQEAFLQTVHWLCDDYDASVAQIMEAAAAELQSELEDEDSE